MTFDLDDLARRVRAGERAALARAVTLVESARPKDRARAEALTSMLAPHAGGALRLGLTGVPGVGKSTLIERLGMMLVEAGEKVAVLAIDPSSTLTKGAILGDKTRMTDLAAHDRAFVRPSASGGALGGVAARTKEAMLLLEAAGFDVVIVETVGVGQSETLVADMVDLVAALMLPGAGDELQGVKKGLLERIDLLAVAKADDPESLPVRQAMTHYGRALSIQFQASAPPVTSLSALTGAGVADFWRIVARLHDEARAKGALAEKRRRQDLAWLERLIAQKLDAALEADGAARDARAAARSRVGAGEASPSAAAQSVLDAFLTRR